MTKEARIYKRERTASSINGVGKKGHPQAKERNWTPIVSAKWIKDLNIIPEAIKLLRENVSSTTPDLAMIFLDMSPKSKGTKPMIDKWNYIKQHSKGNHQQSEKATYEIG